MSADWFKIVDKLLSGGYDFWHIFMTFFILCIVYLLYINRKNILEFIKDIFDKFSLRENNLNSFLKEVKPFSKLEQEATSIKLIATGDYVKDLLLSDLIDIIVNVVEEKVNKYLNSLDFENLEKDSVHNECSNIMISILREIKENMLSSFPRVVYSRIRTSLSELEGICQYEITEYNDCGEGAEELLRHLIKTICGKYSGIMNSIGHTFHSMNGELNGVCYKNHIVGVYDSSKMLKGNYPLPNNCSESDINRFTCSVRNETGCSSVSLLTFHDTDMGLTDVSDIGNRTVSMTYSFEGNIDKSRYQRQRVIKIINADKLENLLHNSYIFSERDKEYDFSSLRNFLSSNNLRAIVIQPVLRNKEELIGLLFLEWKNSIDLNIQDIEDKFHGYAARCVRFFSYWEN